MIISKIEHISLRVPDLEVAVEFYESLFGLVEIARNENGVYLATGKSPTFDVHLTEGANRLDHFAFGVRSAEALEEARTRLSAAGVTYQDSGAINDPGLDDGIILSLPSGHVMELVLAANPRTFVPNTDAPAAHHRVTGPIPLEHITLLTSSIRPVVEFLVDTLDWRISDSWQPGEGQPWRNTWIRAGELHHDLAFLYSESETPELHHFCFAVPSVQDMVRVADALGARGIPLDASFGRHIAGNNVFLYFKDPFGNRCEVNTDMARIDPAAPPRVSRTSFPFDAWQQKRPEALVAGSPVRDGRS
ncbi:VOC family protein [Georgenia sp. Z1491]|uniref:VOC family protein n=1 Tax=Georgenia sp. Z1491 TaxID=3416707 RepID=UPI003CEB69BB